MRFCPYAQRIHLVLEAKKIPYKTININLENKPEWLFEANPNGKVPCLQILNRPCAPFIYESMLIAEYLDEAYPEIRLYPEDPLEKVQEKILIQNFTALESKFYQGSSSNDKSIANLLWKQIENDLDLYESELSKRGTKYFGGDNRPNILDYALWPMFQRINMADYLFNEECQFSGKRFPALVDDLFIINYFISLILFYFFVHNR